MDPLKRLFKEKAEKLYPEMRAFIKENKDLAVDTVKLAQVFGGMRGVRSMIWEPSQLDAHEGIRFRGYSIPQLREVLPKRYEGDEPLPEGLFWLMLTGEIPTQENVDWLSDEWERRRQIPDHVFKVLDALPEETHPMAQFSIAVSALRIKSVFVKKYAEGLSKADYWDPTYEDSMNLIACLPKIAAYIYRRTYHRNIHIDPDDNLDWAGSFAHMLGVSESEDFKSLMRLYLTIHADHEGGNASAHTTHLVGSTLSDAYLSFAAGLNSLAGPLHGLANQEVIKWIFEMATYLDTTTPTNDQIAEFVHKTLDEGKVIPGYGHAVLRLPDPRYTAQRVFSEKYIKDDDYVKIVWQILEVVPPILQSLGKVKNPWPNVDAHSGVILVHYGLNQYSYYTVLFGVSRALGVLSALCWSRAMGFPLERPKSFTFNSMKKIVSDLKKEAF